MTVEAPSTHRDRLLAGMAAAVSERGSLAGTTVADVVRHARTSRRTFYEHFVDRDACYLELFGAAIAAQMQAVNANVRPGPIGEQLESLVSAWLDTLAEAPDLATSFVRDLPGLGARGAEAQAASLERFATLLVELTADRDDVASLSHDIALAVVAGLRELVVTARGQGRDVHELQPVAVQLLRAVSAPGSG